MHNEEIPGTNTKCLCFFSAIVANNRKKHPNLVKSYPSGKAGVNIQYVMTQNSTRKKDHVQLYIVQYTDNLKKTYISSSKYTFLNVKTNKEAHTVCCCSNWLHLHSLRWLTQR